MVPMGSDPPPPKRLPRHFRNDDIPTDTFTPRAYQVELLDAALHKNTIVCLGSVSGNTFLSVMLIRELSDQLRSSLTENGKRSFVLINNESGIFNLYNVIQHHTDLTVSKFHNDEGEQCEWNIPQWSEHVRSHHIIIMPPKLFRMTLDLGAVTVSQINLVIFDDCHLILQDHPYVDIMKHLQKSYLDNPKHFPRILGLTSSFTSKKCRDPQELEASIKSLESSLMSKAETATLVIAERYGMRPKELIVECDVYVDETGISMLLESVLCDALDFLNNCNVVDEDDEERDPCSIPITALSTCLNILHILGPWCASCIANMLLNQIEKIDKHETVVIQKRFLHFASTQLRMISKIFDSKFSPNYDVEELLMYTSPKVRALVGHLRKYKPECDFMIISSTEGELDGILDLAGDIVSDLSDDSDFSEDEGNPRDHIDNRNIIHVAVKKDQDGEKAVDPIAGEVEKYLCGIVFVEDRNVALVLNKFLEEVCAWDETLCFVKSHHITGQSMKGSVTKKSRLYRKQEDCLRKFRMQDLNLLISTSVLEEGIDVPKCNLIVKFDPPKDYKSYSQSKGRARARDAEYIILVDSDKMDVFQEEYQVFKSIEQVLIGRHLKDEGEDCSTDDDKDYDDIIPPYTPNPDNPNVCVSLSFAIALVNRYCAKLPSDAFTHLTPKCSVEEVQTEDGVMFQASLRLPINSPYKELVQGSIMPTVQLAKKEAAQKMCIILHQSGELDDTLMPVGKELFNVEEEDVAEWETEDLYGEARPGTTKRKQYYFKRLADALVNSHPMQKGNYLYNLSMVLTKPISEEQNTRGRKIYAPEESPRGFGILTTKVIPQIPMFPVYTRSGEVMVSIELEASDVVISSEELERLSYCHHFVFENVLRLEKDPMEFNPKQSELGYLVVPLCRDGDNTKHKLDWDFVSKIEESKSHVKRNIFDSKRDLFIFNENEYVDAVVMPSYRNIDQPQHFYVAEIRHDLNPLSPFPSPELYKTFSEYYTTKYGLTITNIDQPLLDVDHTSARLNLLTPRYMNQKGIALPTSSAETKKARRENLQQKQILVPELCEIHVFPASLWKKAVCLPTILYRINYLLVAEEIRIKISSETGIGLKDLPEDFKFEPLDFGFEISDGKENGHTSTSNMHDVNEMDTSSPESFLTNGDSPNSDKGSYNESLSEESPSEGHKVKDISEIISTSHPDHETKCVPQRRRSSLIAEAPCDTKCVPQRRRSSLTVVNLFSQEGLHDYLASSKALCDKSSCDSEDEEASEKNEEQNKADDTEELKSHGNDEDTEDHLKASDIEEVKASDNEEVKASDNEEVKASDNEEVLASDDEEVKASEIQVNDASNDTFQTHSSHISQEKQLCDKIPTGSNEGSIMLLINGWSSTEPNNDIHAVKQASIKCEKTKICGVTNDVQKFTLNDSNTKTSGKEETMMSDKEGEVFIQMSESVTGTQTCEIKTNTEDSEESSFPYPELSLDEDKDLSKFVGPNPCTILQAMTMSNANDFFSLERLETIGDSFLKYAITVHLYCTYPGIHEGKLSYLRSKQVSNCNLYRLGKRKGLAECMISTKFEPYENWLPPGYVINDSKRKGPVPKVLLVRTNCGNLEKVSDQAVIDSYNADDSTMMWTPKITEIKEIEGTKTEKIQKKQNLTGEISKQDRAKSTSQKSEFDKELQELSTLQDDVQDEETSSVGQSMIPYSLQTLHSIPDKSIADCVESLIGCYLTSCGKKAALQFMHWLGLKVLPPRKMISTGDDSGLMEDLEKLKCPSSPLLEVSQKSRSELDHLLIGYDKLEDSIGYRFNDRSYLLQAFTHASYHYNTITDCYQRLEFLGDAILDYVITRHLYEDSCKYSPGVLTDLRSALVNNNIFAALAVKWDFHKYFKAISPPLFHVIEKFVARQKEREDEIDLSDEEENGEEEAETVELEVPKALGDIFESLAGAIYLDSGMSLDVVWRVYYRIMKPQIDKYLKSIPKSPVRELLEMEPETAKFEKPERTLEGKIRVKVNVVSKGVYTGIGRNYRIAKSAAAKKALRSIKAMQLGGLI